MHIILTQRGVMVFLFKYVLIRLMSAFAVILNNGRSKDYC